MISELYAVYDQKAKAYLPIFEVANEDLAVRQFAQVINTPQHPIGANPEDYRLFCLGTKDIESGVVTPNKNGPGIIIDGILLLRTDAKPNGKDAPDEISNEPSVQPGTEG